MHLARASRHAMLKCPRVLLVLLCCQLPAHASSICRSRSGFWSGDFGWILSGKACEDAQVARFARGNADPVRLLPMPCSSIGRSSLGATPSSVMLATISTSRPPFAIDLHGNGRRA